MGELWLAMLYVCRAARRAWEETCGDLLFWPRYTDRLRDLLDGAEVEVVPRLRVRPDVVRAAMEWRGVGPPDPRFTFVRVEFARFSFWLVFDTGAGRVAILTPMSPPDFLVLGCKLECES